MSSFYDVTSTGRGQYDITTVQHKTEEPNVPTTHHRTYSGSSTALKAFGVLVFSTLIEGAMANYGCYKYKMYDCDDIKIVNNTFSLDGCRMKCDDWGDCFSSNMTLNVEGKGPVPMRDLRPGMVVELSNGNTFTITDLPHRDPTKTIDYLRISFEGGNLEISQDHHLILKHKETGEVETLFAKKVVSFSDQYQVQYKGEWVDIDGVEWTKEEGVYTVEGLNVNELEVNGVRVGAYSKTNSPFLARMAMLPRQIFHSVIGAPEIKDDTVRSESSFERKLVDSISSQVSFLF